MPFPIVCILLYLALFGDGDSLEKAFGPEDIVNENKEEKNTDLRDFGFFAVALLLFLMLCQAC